MEDTLMLILSIVGIVVSSIGVYFSWDAKKNAKVASKEATNAKNAADAARQAIKVKKDIESLSEVISFIDKTITTVNKRLSGNIDRGANINSENQLLRDCTALVSRNEERIKNNENKWRVQSLRGRVERDLPKYIDGHELNAAAEEIVSGLKEVRQIFASENENAIY